MTEEKYVTYRHLKKAGKISGAKQGNSWHSFKGYVKEVNAAYVISRIMESRKQKNGFHRKKHCSE